MRGSGSDCCKQHALVVAWFAVGGCGMRWCKKAVKRESNLQNNYNAPGINFGALPEIHRACL